MYILISYSYVLVCSAILYPVTNFKQNYKQNKKNKIMSLDISLYRSYQISYDEGKTVQDKEECVYNVNITHSLREIAKKAFIYKHLWRPEGLGFIKAGELIEGLEKGLKELKGNPEYYKKFNSPNGWGMYEHFVPFVGEYLNACKEYPNAIICISR